MSQSPISFKGYMKLWILNQVQDDSKATFVQKNIPHRHSVLDTESTVTSNRRDSHTPCNPEPWILNRVQDDRGTIIPFQDDSKATLAEKTPRRRHSVLDTESTVTSNRRESHTPCNPEPWILNRVQDDRESVTASNRTNK
jgi:hypothetical protein